jgi:hypothetical protein
MKGRRWKSITRVVTEGRDGLKMEVQKGELRSHRLFLTIMHLIYGNSPRPVKKATTGFGSSSNARPSGFLPDWRKDKLRNSIGEKSVSEKERQQGVYLYVDFYSSCTMMPSYSQVRRLGRRVRRQVLIYILRIFPGRFGDVSSRLCIYALWRTR